MSLLIVLAACGLAVGTSMRFGADAATPPTLDLQVLLIGEGSSDATTAAWQEALTTEGVPYTLVTATGTAPNETVTLPALSSGNTGYYNGVIIADSPSDYAAGALSALDSYESTFAVRQVDGYMYPSPALGATAATAGALDGTTATLTSAGLAAFPELNGPVTFDTGTYGYAATADSGAPYTPILTDSAGDVLAGVYEHPTNASPADPQAGVSELSLYFDYNAGQLQWLLLAPGLINWVTQDTHLGLYRNYVEMDIDDTFTPDDAWDVTNHTIDYSDADALRMQPADVVYAAEWSKANNFRLDQLFNYGSSVAAQSGDLVYDGSASAPTTYDPLTAEFQATDPATGEPYSDDFGWISHTYDTPYLDMGCATENYIEAELNENTSSIAAAPGATAGTGGLGIAESDDTSLAYGTEDPQVFVPGNHSGFADLVPGNPGTVDPPDLDSWTAADTTGGTLAAGTYEYAVTDQFSAADSPDIDQSSAFVTPPITLSGTDNSVTLNWQAICHAANYLVYRSQSPYTTWSLVGSLATPPSATLPDNSAGDPTSTTDVTGGGELEETYTDSGADGTAQPSGWTPPVQENANETMWEQNPYFVPALEAVGITAVGDDASKPYPDPADSTFGPGTTGPATYTGATYAAGQTWVDGTAQVVPRHPINIYYNASTEAQEVDEYNTLYLSSADGGQCTSSSTTTCLTTPATFQDVVNQVVSGMFQFTLENNPEPSYVHQTNLMGSPPGCGDASEACDAAPPSAAPGTADTTGDGLLYSVLNPLLAEYNADFSPATPYVQLTEGAIGTVLAEQAAWGDGVSGVTATEQNGTVTVTNSGSGINVPVTVPAGTTVNGAAFGQAYGGTLSDWVNLGTGSTETLNENVAPAITSGTSATSIVGTPFSFTVETTGAPTAAITESGALPAGLSFADNGNGTATIAGTAESGSGGSYPITITATSSAGSATQSFTLTNAQAPTITSASTATFSTGVAGTYTVTTTGYPAPSITESGTLPSGLTFTDNGTGTGTIAGTPATGTAGSYPVTLSATNTSGSTATLALTITVNTAAAPAITSSNVADFTLNEAGSITITTTGSPAPAIAETGTLPAGLTFTDNGNGTATLSGTPTATGTSDLTITASNGIAPDATQTIPVVVGEAPAFTSADSATAAVGTAFNFTVTTTGYPVPSFGWSNLPPGVTFTDNGDGTGTLSGTPTTAGTYAVALTAASAYGSAQQTLTITVTQAPAITSGDAVTFTAGSAGTFTVTTTGNPTAAITESGALPSGVTLVDNGNGTATLSGTPATGTDGSYPITISAANGVSPTATQAFTLTVSAAPAAPAITSTSSDTFTVGSAGTFTVTTTGNPTATITESGALPSGVTLVDNGNGTAILSGTPATGASGSYPITITAANGVSPSATQTFTIAVDPANVAPLITSSGATTFAAGQAGTFSVTTTGTPTAAISATSSPALPSGVSLVDNGTGTATLAGTPPAGSQGTYTLTITAANTAGTATQSFVLTVNSGLAITSANSATATAGSAFSFTVTTAGTPAPTLTHTGTLPSGLTFTANTNGTATLSGTVASTAEGIYPLTFSAKNSTGTASQAFTLTVAKVPSFSSTATLTETAGAAFTFAVTATGYPTPSLSASGLPAGVSFSDNGNGSGTLSGTTAIAAGTYSVPVTATNAGGSATQTITLTVTAAKKTTQTLPTFTSAATATATAGTAFSFTVATTGSPTTTYTTSVTHSGTLPGGVSFDNLGNGEATLTGTPTQTSGGTYPITLTAKNAAGTVTQAFVLIVTAKPTITTATSATATVGSGFNFTVKTTGAPAPALAAAGALPQGLTWTDNGNGTATLAGTPGVGQGGVYKLTFTATNTGGTATQSFTLTVDQAPAIVSANSAAATHGKAFSFTFTSTGYPLANVTHTGTVAGLSYDNLGNGTATLTGTPKTAGTYTLTITAKNSVGTTTQTFTLTVS
jgi:hypothetical protein